MSSSTDDAIASIADKAGVLTETSNGSLQAVRRALGMGRARSDPDATLPLVTGNSHFVLRERAGDILNFTRPI